MAKKGISWPWKGDRNDRGFRSDIVVVSTINDDNQGSAAVAYKMSPAPYEKSKSLVSKGFDCKART
jgi:hypothetical protein